MSDVGHGGKHSRVRYPGRRSSLSDIRRNQSNFLVYTYAQLQQAVSEAPDDSTIVIASEIHLPPAGVVVDRSNIRITSEGGRLLPKGANVVGFYFGEDTAVTRQNITIDGVRFSGLDASNYFLGAVKLNANVDFCNIQDCVMEFGRGLVNASNAIWRGGLIDRNKWISATSAGHFAYGQFDEVVFGSNIAGTDNGGSGIQLAGVGCGACAIVNNNMWGDNIHTSAAGGGCIIDGNHNVGTLTNHGGDTVGDNS